MISLLGILQWLRPDPELLLESADGLELYGGAAYDAQWKLTDHDLGLDIPVGWNRVFALGPLEHALLWSGRPSHSSRLFQSPA